MKLLNKPQGFKQIIRHKSVTEPLILPMEIQFLSSRTQFKNNYIIPLRSRSEQTEQIDAPQFYLLALRSVSKFAKTQIFLVTSLVGQRRLQIDSLHLFSESSGEGEGL